MSDTIVHLSPEQFTATESEIARCGEIIVTAFRYLRGSLALRIQNAVGHVIVLPFQGQQVWDACFRGRSLRMKSMFDEPRLTQDFLHTYGALLIHCGATAVGPPGPEDTHPPHGELPNAPMDRAWLEFTGEDVRVCGSYRYTVAFQTDYEFRPSLHIGANSTKLTAQVEVENKKRSPMELFYLAHVNFRAVDGARLYDNATGLRLRKDMPSHVTLGKGFAALRDRLIADAGRHRVLNAGDAYDPEMVFFLDFSHERALCVAEHPDGGGDYISFPRGPLPMALRWISRTPDQDCLGLALPTTSEGEGLAKERAKGNAVALGAGETWRCGFEFGCADEPAIRQMRREITRS